MRIATRERIERTRGTAERNKAIFQMYESGVMQADIARLFEVNGHPMSRQQVSEIILREKARRNGNGQ